MVEKLKQHVTIPYWMVTLLATVMIAFLGFLISVTSSAATTQEQVKSNTMDIREHKMDVKETLDKKANKETVDRLYLEIRDLNMKMDKVIERLP